MKESSSIEITVRKTMELGFWLAIGWRFANALYDLGVIILTYLFARAGIG